MSVFFIRMNATQLKQLTEWVKTASYKSLSTMEVPKRTDVEPDAFQDYDNFVEARNERLRVIVGSMSKLSALLNL